MSAHLFAAIPLLIWLCLLTLRGGFWRVPSREPPAPRPSPKQVVVLIPARDEAALIGEAVTSLAQQVFNGTIEIVLVDDGSTDGTAEVALAAARALGASARLTVIAGTPLPPGWTGKLWALAQGLNAALPRRPDYLLFTDADVRHAPDSIASLVANAEANDRDLVSYMVRLSAVSWAERLLIPAFVFFFFMIYPPAWISSARRRTAAAAGGCILIRPAALARIGGLHGIRSRIIDDCALARAVKATGGRIWLGLARETRSLRHYRSAAEIGAMISRTAFAQLEHSYLLLTATLLGLFLTYFLPLMLLFFADLRAVWLGIAALALMSACYLPMVRFYRQSPLWCLALPAIALFYCGAVVHSAAQHARGSGGRWKGRAQDVAE